MNITILHLSDIQYGRHHVDRTPSRSSLYPDENYSVQTIKIIDDLKILENENIKLGFRLLTVPV